MSGGGLGDGSARDCGNGFPCSPLGFVHISLKSEICAIRLDLLQRLKHLVIRRELAPIDVAGALGIVALVRGGFWR